MTVRKVWFILIGAVTLALAVSACGVGPDQSREDARDTTDVDKSPPHVIAFNNHVPNLATKCDGYGHRVYMASRPDATAAVVPVVINDESCR